PRFRSPRLRSTTKGDSEQWLDAVTASISEGKSGGSTSRTRERGHDRRHLRTQEYRRQRPPAAVMRIEEAGVEIRSYLSDAPISLADETSEIHTIFNSLAASFERRRARQRTYDALRRRAEAGAVTGGRVFGYRNERNGTGYVHRVIDETEAAI